MNIKNRLFPYPVLCGETDDYLSTTEFSISPKLDEKLHELIFDYDYYLKCDSLEKYIRENSAEFVLHLECSSTAFRIALKSGTPRIEYRLPKSRVNGEITQVAMIVATRDFVLGSSNDLNEDYFGESFQIKKGQILAYQNLPSIYVQKKTEELAYSDSFFTVVKQTGLDPEEIKPLSFNLTSSKIMIFVDEGTYNSYLYYKSIQSVALSMLVLPALTYMIHEVSDSPESFSQYEWFQRMDKYYKSIGKDFVNDILYADENPIMIAQEMLKNPIGLAYRTLVEREKKE